MIDFTSVIFFGKACTFYAFDVVAVSIFVIRPASCCCYSISMNPVFRKGGHAPRLLLFVMLLSWCGALLSFRFARSGSLALGFLAWNLFLAAVPAVAAWFFARAMGKE